MTLEDLNISLFSAINGPADPGSAMLLLAKGLAEWVIYLMALWMLIAWIRGARALRVALLDAGFAVVLGLVTNRVIVALWYHPRPFELGLGHQLLPHAVDASFPSDHGTFVFALALSLLIHQASRGWGWLALVLAVGVAWSRVYLGVHFPMDMAGSFLVSAVAVAAIRTVSCSLERRIYPAFFALYGWLLKVLHLPQSLFPRDVRD